MYRRVPVATDARRISDRPARFVLELNAGEAERLKPGRRGADLRRRHSALSAEAGFAVGRPQSVGMEDDQPHWN